MEIIQMLRFDHRELRALCRELLRRDQLDDRTREFHFLQLFDLAGSHMIAEEQVVYDRLRWRRSMGALLTRGMEAHYAASTLLEEVWQLSFESDRWRPRMAALSDAIDRHILEEEVGLFPLMEETLVPTELSDMGQSMLDMKEFNDAPVIHGRPWRADRAGIA